MATTSNILKTPVEIARVYLAQFPSAAVEEVVAPDGQSILALGFVHRAPFFILRNAVITREFSKALRDLSWKIEKASGDPPIGIKIDIEGFSVPTSLTDWMSFRRFLYEKSGNRCANAVLAFLQDPGPSNLSMLVRLGLSPEQVEIDCKESEFAYFLELKKKWEEMPPDVKSVSFQNFQRLYPKVSGRFISELVHGDRTSTSGPSAYDRVLEELNKRVIGQPWATETVASALISQQDNNKVFLFVGPTGVGKTELALACGFLKNNRFVCFNMEKFSREGSITEFFGSTTGYRGSGDKPCFIKEMDQFNPRKILENDSNRVYEVSGVVVLFDEFERACREVLDSLLTILSKGYCTFSVTNSGAFRKDQNLNYRYEFKNCIIICTSNLFDKQILMEFEKGASPKRIAEDFKEWNRRCPTGGYSEPILGRLCVIPFGPIPRGRCYQSILRSQLATYMKSFKADSGCREFCLEDEALVLAALETLLYGKGVDLRRIEKYFQHQISPIIFGKSKAFGDMSTKKFTLHCDRDGLFIQVSTFLKSIGQYTDVDGIIFRLI